MTAESPVSLWIAVGSFVVSGVALGWNIYRDAVDRGALRVYCYMGQAAQMGVGVIANNLLVWKVTNVGRRPVMVTTIGGRRKRSPRNWLVIVPSGDTLPRMLQPGEIFTGFTDDLQAIDSGVEELFAIDSLSRTYRAPKAQVRGIVADVVQRHASGNATTQRGRPEET